MEVSGERAGISIGGGRIEQRRVLCFGQINSPLDRVGPTRLQLSISSDRGRDALDLSGDVARPGHLAETAPRHGTERPKARMGGAVATDQPALLVDGDADADAVGSRQFLAEDL